MATKRTDEPFREELPKLLNERGMSIRGLAAKLEISDAYISRVLHGGRPPSPSLLERVSSLLELPQDYFPEVRLRVVLAAVEADPRLRDELYRRLERSRQRSPR